MKLPAILDQARRDGSDPVSAVRATASSALLDGRIWLERSPWRINAGWSVIAALLAGGILTRLDEIDPLHWMLLFLLLDLLWGSIWGAMTLPNSLPNLEQFQHRPRVWLPYLHSGSPAARLLGKDSPGILAVVSRVALPGIALSLLISALFGSNMLWMTVAVIGLSVGGWLHRQVPLVPVLFLFTLITVTLPWAATLLQLERLSGAGARDLILFVGLWTLHGWGGNRLLANRTDRIGMGALAIAQIGISTLLILIETPLWLAILSVLWLPTWLTVYRQYSLWQVELWWLLALLVSSMALGQGMS